MTAGDDKGHVPRAVFRTAVAWGIAAAAGGSLRLAQVARTALPAGKQE